MAEAGYSNTLVVGGRLLLGGLQAQAMPGGNPTGTSGGAAGLAKVTNTLKIGPLGNN